MWKPVLQLQTLCNLAWFSRVTKAISLMLRHKTMIAVAIKRMKRYTANCVTYVRVISFFVNRTLDEKTCIIFCDLMTTKLKFDEHKIVIETSFQVQSSPPSPVCSVKLNVGMMAKIARKCIKCKQDMVKSAEVTIGVLRNRTKTIKMNRVIPIHRPEVKDNSKTIFRLSLRNMFV